MVLLPRLVALGAALLLAGCSSSSSGQASSRPATTPSATATPSAPPTDPTYLALGDSVAAGTGAEDPVRGGYVPVLAGLLSERLGCPDDEVAGCPVQVRNLAVPGATTATLVRDQLPVALDVLRSGGGVRTVTVTVGGNDVFVPVLRACAQAPEAPACDSAVQTAVEAVDAGVDQVLAGLTDAAGAGTTVAVMTYYDPLAACRLAPLQPLAERVLEGTADSAGLNDVLRARAADSGAVLVETRGLLRAPEDFVGGLDCLHPSTRGHARLAAAFAAALTA